MIWRCRKKQSNVIVCPHQEALRGSCAGAAVVGTGSRVEVRHEDVRVTAVGEGSDGQPFFRPASAGEVDAVCLGLSSCEGAATMGNHGGFNPGPAGKRIPVEDSMVGVAAAESAAVEPKLDDVGRSVSLQNVDDNLPRTVEEGDTLVGCFQLVNAEPIDPK